MIRMCLEGMTLEVKKNEVMQLLIPNTLLKPSIHISDMESLIASFDGRFSKCRKIARRRNFVV